jgi:hypothetical protein
MNPPLPPTAPESLSPLDRVGRVLVRAAVVLFVVWQVFFLLVRNPLDLWGDDIKKWCKAQPWWWAAKKPYEKLDQATTRYANLLGIEQGWTMFAPPMARGAPFLAARLEFADGSQEEVYSPNEPDPARFLRLGGWRQRKLEDFLIKPYPDEISDKEDLPVWQAYVRWSVRRWRQAHPDDPRQLERVVLVRRWITFPGPNDAPTVFGEPDVREVGRFNPDGSLP